MATRIQLRRGTAAEWTAANPILAQGEMGVETDTNKFKIGNGVDSWTILTYGGLTGPTGPAGPAGPAGEPGEPGVVSAISPIVYNSETQTISLDLNSLIIDGGTA